MFGTPARWSHERFFLVKSDSSHFPTHGRSTTSPCVVRLPKTALCLKHWTDQTYDTHAPSLRCEGAHQTRYLSTATVSQLMELRSCSTQKSLTASPLIRKLRGKQQGTLHTLCHTKCSSDFVQHLVVLTMNSLSSRARCHARGRNCSTPWALTLTQPMRPPAVQQPQRSNGGDPRWSPNMPVCVCDQVRLANR